MVLDSTRPYRSIAAYVVALLLVVSFPLGFATALLFERQAGDIALTERKSVGLEATVRLDALVHRLRELRRGTVRRGRVPLAERLSVESSFTRLRDYVLGPGRILGLDDSLGRLSAIWHGVPERGQGLRAVDRTISATLDFMRFVEERSALRSDIAERTTALVDALVVQFPIVGDRADQEQNLLIAAYRSRRNLGGAALGVEIFSAQADRAYSTARSDLGDLAASRPSDVEARRRVVDVGRRLDQFRSRARSAAAGSLRRRRDARPFLTAGRALATALDLAVSALARDVRQDFAERLDRQEGFVARLRSGAYAAIAAFVFLGVMLGRTLARRRRLAEEVARREESRIAAEFEHRRSRELLALTEARFEAVFDRTSVGIAIVERTGAIVRQNEALGRIVPSSGNDFIGLGERSFARLVVGEIDEYAIEVAHGNGARLRWTEADVSSIRSERGEVLFAVAIVKDVTDRHESAERLLRESRFDGLVALPNRTYFMERLGAALSGDGDDDFGGLAFLALDEFGAIVDSLGHGVGDRILVEAAQRLCASTVRGDVAARLSASDFAVAFRRRDRLVEDVARLVREMERPFAIDDREIVVRPRVGLVAIERIYASVDELFLDAETALRAAKSTGPTSFASFEPAMRDRASRRLDVLTNLRRALERDQLHLYYQPIVDLDSTAIAAFEVLLRWEHPELGAVSPAEFVPIAEDVGLIRPIGRWVFDRACAQLRTWRRRGPSASPAYLSINVSAQELAQNEYAGFVETTLSRYGLDGGDVVLEITEGVILSSDGETHANIERLRSSGVRFSIDDFGTGFSSLRYLQAFAFDFLKIDQSFIRGRGEGLASPEIVAMVVALGTSLGVTVVAEGVETATQATQLRALGTHKGQGYLFGRPVAASAVRGTFSTRRTAATTALPSIASLG